MVDPRLVRLAKFIIGRREELGMKYTADLAKKADVSSSHLSRIERAEFMPSAKYLKLLAAPLQVPAEKLLELAGYIEKEAIEEKKEQHRIAHKLEKLTLKEKAMVERLIDDLLSEE